MMDPVQSYNNYRQRLRTINPPAIPFLFFFFHNINSINYYLLIIIIIIIIIFIIIFNT